MPETESLPAGKSWPDYRAVWRWHFYAGLVCIPFLVILSISGAIYLFKAEIESWIDAPYDSLKVVGKPSTAADQIKAALAAVPGSSLNGYELPREPDDAVRVLVAGEGGVKRVYVHPESREILHSVDESSRFMKVLFRLHGELLLGNRGSTIVETAASWAIVMVLTGLFLWWPRKAKGLGGVVYPRLGGGSRIFWRDLHGVTGFWISAFVLFLLFSGLPWAKFWGDYLKNVRKLTGTSVVRQDWSNGQEKPAVAATTTRSPSESGEHAGHGGGGSGWRRNRGKTPGDLSAVDRIVATVRPLNLPPPVVIAPAPGTAGEWTAKSMTANRTQRVDLVLDGKTGAIKDRKDFRDRHLIDRVVGTGIAAHEGRLFGWPNQLLGLLTALGLILLSLSSVVLWWRRRDPGVLGAPGMAARPRFSLGLLVLVVLFGLYLPLFGATLLFVLLLEKAILIRIPVVRDWLGLGSYSQVSRVELAS